MANLKLTFDDFESNDFELLAIHSNLKDFNKDEHNIIFVTIF